MRIINSANIEAYGVSDTFVILPQTIEAASQVWNVQWIERSLPNPFSKARNIKLTIQVDSRIKLLLYDTTGRLVDRIFDGNITPGYHSITYSKNLARGVYFLKLEGWSGEKKEYTKVVKILKI